MTNSVTIEDVYQELKRIKERMVTREDIESLIDSIEISDNPETMDALHKSEHDIKSGRVKAVTSVEDLLNEI